MASAMDGDALAMVLQVFNQVGTPGTTPGVAGWTTSTAGDKLLNYSAPSVFLNAGACLDAQCAPRDKTRRAVLNQWAMAQAVSGLSGLMNDQDTLGRQYMTGILTTALGFDVGMDQNVPTLTNGVHGGTPLVKGASQTGSTLLTNGWTAGVNVLKAGEIFWITGVNSANPDSQLDNSMYQYFVVTADVTSDSSGNATIPIYPPMIVVGTNVGNGTVMALAADGAAINLGSGSASTAYPLNVMYHHDAFTFATADLEMPRGVDFAGRENWEGVSILIVRAYDINNAQFPSRADVLAAYTSLRPELACRMVG
jgi:hypothetical protein